MKILTAVIVTAILAYVAGWYVLRKSRQAWQTQQWNDIVLPTQHRLDEIVAGFNRGEQEVAMQKLRSLQQQWTQYAEACRKSRQTRQIHQWSDVALPTQRMLDEIVVEFDRGEQEVAMQQLRSLQQHWTQHVEGGATPELFQKEVAAIGMKTNAAPDGAAHGSQPIRSETNRTSPAAGSRR